MTPRGLREPYAGPRRDGTRFTVPLAPSGEPALGD